MGTFIAFVLTQKSFPGLVSWLLFCFPRNRRCSSREAFRARVRCEWFPWRPERLRTIDSYDPSSWPLSPEPLQSARVIESTVKSRFNESRFNVMSQFKEWNLVTKMKFHIKKSQFRVKSRFKETKCADWGHSLNRDFTVRSNLVIKIDFGQH